MATALAPPPTTSLLSTDSALYPPQIDEANHVIRELGLALDGLGHSASFIRFKRPVNELAVQSPRVRQPLAASPASPVNTADVAVNMAAMYADAALKGRKFEGFDNNEFVGGKDVRWRSSRVTYYHILHSRAWRVIYVTVCLLHIALALAEAPALIPCPRAIAFAVEWLCLAVYAIDLLFSYRVSHSFASFAMQRWRAARCGLLLAIAVDVVVGMSIPGSYRFSRGLRPFMLIFRLRNVRKVFAACASTLRRALLIYTLIGFLTTLFGFVGYSLMASTCTGMSHTCSCHRVIDVTLCYPLTADGHLSHITTALYHLLLLQTTLGVFATEMLPYYVASKWSLLFFLTFAVIVNLLVAKMVIAVGYDSYRSYMRGKILKHVAMRDQALSVAYKLLDAGDGVTLDSWMALCAQLKRPDDLVSGAHFPPPPFPPSPSPLCVCDVQTARVLFHSVCGEGECEAVDMRQFAELCLRVNAKAVAKRRVAVDTRLQRGLAHTRVRLQRMMRRTLTLLETVRAPLPCSTVCVTCVCVMCRS